VFIQVDDGKNYEKRKKYPRKSILIVRLERFY